MSSTAFAQQTHFIENLGQWKEDFDYKLNLDNGGVYFSSHELVFHFSKTAAAKVSKHNSHPHSVSWQVGDIIKSHAYKVSFVGSNPEAISRKGKKKRAYHNYLLGKDRSRWKNKVGLYETIEFIDVYENIDAHYYFNSDGNLKYDFVLAPGADPNQIELEYTGTDGVDLVYGNLIVKNSVENVLESAPYAYQEINGERSEVYCIYTKEEDRVGFELGNYDPNYSLVIDPVLIFSTYSGSSSDNFGFTATYGVGGEAYGGGIVFNQPSTSSYPVSLGAFQDTFQGGNVDIGVSKYVADGSNLIYSTYLGGQSNEMPHSMIEGPNKDLILIGSTGSTDFPTTVDAYDTVFDVGNSTSVSIGGGIIYPSGSDIFVLRLDSTGGNLIGSTFFGGNSADGINAGLRYNYGDDNRGDVVLDSLGNVYVVSSTISTNIPNVGPHTPSGPSWQDGLVFSLTGDLKTLNWSTYLGGTGHDAVLSVKLKNNRELYVAGITSSSDLGAPYTGGFNSNYLGADDGFIAKIDAQTGDVSQFTYNGTADADRNFFLDIDHNGHVYVMGQTSGQYSIKGNNVFYQNNGSQFIDMYTEDLSTSLRSMTFGDNSLNRTEISPTAFMVDNCLNLYVSGWGSLGFSGTQGYSHQLPVTQNPSDVQGARSTTDSSDFYFMILDASWEKVNFGAYFGSVGGSADHVDGGTSRFNKDGTVYQAVCAGCGGFDDFPTSAGVYSSTNPSPNCNLAVIKFSLEQDVQADFVPDIDSSCIPYTATLINRSYNGDIYYYRGPGGSFIQDEPQQILVNQTGNQEYTIVALDTTCGFSDTISLTLYGFVDSLDADFTSDHDSCENEYVVSFTNLSLHASSYYWDFGDGNFSTDINPTHDFKENGTYTVNMFVTSDICSKVDTVTQNLVFKSRSSQGRFLTNYEACRDGTFAEFRALGTGFKNYIWSVNGVPQADSTIFRFDFETYGTYVVTLESIDSACGIFLVEEEIIEIEEDDREVRMPNFFSPNNDNENELFGPLGEFGSDYFLEFNMTIYNRWGIELYRSTSEQLKWDGTFNGNNLDEGVYYYLVNYKDICGNDDELNGFVHLFR